MCDLFRDQNMSNSFSEIGSEFWIESVPESFLTVRDGVYCISGRTAIDLILQEIMRHREVKSVAMPAWCCDSMLAPFLSRNIDVQFYDMCYEGGQLKNCASLADTADIFYLTNYFGYENTLPIDMVKDKKEQGSVILYDRTHSFLLDDGEYRFWADYSFASIRKWMGVISGAVIEGLAQPELKDCPYVPVKEKAMCNKYRFLKGDGRIKKERFLKAFGEFNHQLAADYRNYSMDDLSYSLYKQENLQVLKTRRRKNAEFIHESLYGVQYVCELTKGSAPLFVPILFDSESQRDKVRKKLIEQQIYCPIHWPQPAHIPAEFKVNDIVSRELSLLCDQRYGITEMRRQIEIIQSII